MGLVRLLTTPVVYSFKLIGKPIARQLASLRLSLGGEDARRQKEAQTNLIESCSHPSSAFERYSHSG